MRPELGSRNLVNRLKTVVLPAPFGPISAWIVPRRTFRSTPRTAAKPRNSLVRPRVSRIKSSNLCPAPTLFHLPNACIGAQLYRGIAAPDKHFREVGV